LFIGGLAEEDFDLAGKGRAYSPGSLPAGMTETRAGAGWQGL
jgi:hypothetical protein